MPQLLIVRHAIAMKREEAPRHGLSDAERPLTEKGIKRMKGVTAGIAAQIPIPIQLLSSPLLRAQQTAEILATRYPGLTVTTEAGLAPGAPLKPLIASLNRQAPDGLTVLVGHEPDLSNLISLLLFGEVSAAVQLKKGGAALLDLPQGIAAGKATLFWLLTPKQLSTHTR